MVAAIAATTMSCTKDFFMNKDELARPQGYALGEPRTVSITASSAKNSGNDKLFVRLSNSGPDSVLWETGDVIRVNNSSCTIHRVDDVHRSIGYFYPNSLSACTTAVSGKDVYYAVYPSTLIASASDWGGGGSLIPTIKLPSRQTYVDVSSLNKMTTNYMAAYTVADPGSTDITLHFKNLCSMLILKLKTSSGTKNVSKICVRTTASASTLFNTSSGTLSFSGQDDNAVPAITAINPDNTARAITLDCNASSGGVQITTTPKDFVIMLPISSGTALSSGDLILEIYNQDSSAMTLKTLALSSTTKLERSKYYTSEVVVTEDRVGFIGGEFSVTDTKVIRFARGNLQWSKTGGGSNNTNHTVYGGGTKVGTWRFAPNQWDYVGGTEDNIHYGTISGSSNSDGFKKLNNNESYTGWIDLFGWGNSGCNNSNLPYNMDASTATGDLNGTKYDWGYYNAISGGGDTPNLWRTLTMQEWEYLFRTRTNALQKIGYATVNSVKGIVILPDNFTFPTSALETSWAPFTANGTWIDENPDDHGEWGMIYTTSKYTDNTYDITNWGLMEKNGAVFLPANGYRKNSGSGFHAPNNGYYLSATHKANSTATTPCYYSLFSEEKLSYMRNQAWDGDYGRGVRLVMK